MGTGDQAYGEPTDFASDNASDTFIAGTWIGATPATIHDFASNDSIEFYYDSTDGEVINLVDNGTSFEITVDGDTVVLIPVGTSGAVVTLGGNLTLIDVAAATV